jgi:hypothetical protein
MGRPKLICSLKDIERKTGISYPTLIRPRAATEGLC